MADGRAQGDLTRECRVLLVQELRYWCAAAPGAHVRRWVQFHRVHRPAKADEARRWVTALGEAQRALHLYD